MTAIEIFTVTHILAFCNLHLCRVLFILSIELGHLFPISILLAFCVVSFCSVLPAYEEAA